MKSLSHITNLQAFIVLLLIGCTTFISVFFNGFVGDDKEQIYNYGLVKGFLDLPKVFFYHHEVLELHQSVLGAYYKPLMLFYFYTIRMFFGLHPFFYHTPQVLLAITNSFLVFVFFKYFFKKEIAFLLSVVFLVHPINQETVAYASNIQDILFFVFGISGLLLIQRTKDIKNSWQAGALLLLALLSKETGILFLGASVLFVLLYKKGEYKKYLLVFISVVCLYLFLRFMSQSTSVFWIEPSPMSALPFTQRLTHIPALFSYYVKTFIYPDVLTFNQQWIIKQTNFSNFAAPLLIAITFTVSVLFGNVFLYIKKSKYFSPFLFFSIWFFAGLAPHMQLVALDATVADRWFYFSSVGILGMIGVFINLLLVRFPNQKKMFFLCIITICILLAGRTFTRNMEWRDAFTLYSNDTSRAKSALIENNLGDEYFKIGDYKSAREHFSTALKINPKLWIALNNLGIIEEQKGNYSKALFYYNKALKENKRLPIYENIARAQVLSGKQNDAISFIKPALNMYPLSANLWLTLSLAQYEKGMFKDALEFANKSYEIAPDPKTMNVINAINNEIIKQNQ